MSKTAHAVILPMNLPDHPIVLRMRPARRAQVGTLGHSPVRVRSGAAERSEAALI